METLDPKDPPEYIEVRGHRYRVDRPAAPKTVTIAGNVYKLKRKIPIPALGICIALWALIVIVGFQAKQPAVIGQSTPGVPTQPFYQWIPAVHPSVVTMQPGSIEFGNIDASKGGDKIRIVITAKAPVSAGVVSPDDIDQAKQAQNFPWLDTQRFDGCSGDNLISGEVDCEVPDQVVAFYVRDLRTPGQAAGAGIAAVFGVKTPAEQMLQRNDVSFNVARYACVRNCE